MGQPTRHDPYAALRILNFRWFIYSMLAMTVATQIQAVVVSWQIYELTPRSALTGSDRFGRGGAVYRVRPIRGPRGRPNRSGCGSL